MRKSKRNTRILIAVLAVIAVITAAAAIHIAIQNHKLKEQSKQQYNKDNTESGDSSYITYKDKKYRYNTNLRTLLFLGVDKNEEVSVKEVTGRSGQSDCLILLVLDQEKKTTTLLEISRDSMTDVKIYGIDGDYLTTEKAQIATQYAYGEGEKRSCMLTKNAVSNLLYDIPVHDYLALNMAGIAPIVDSIGGVEITVMQDYTEIDPAFTEGSTLTLNGEQAEKYVRSRDITVTGSNNSRMERQTQFIQALLSKVQESEDQGDSMLQSFWTAGESYMTTNLDMNMMEKISSYIIEPEILSVPGEVVAGEEHDEFYVDDDKLQKMIVDVFYEEVGH